MSQFEGEPGESGQGGSSAAASAASSLPTQGGPANAAGGVSYQGGTGNSNVTNITNNFSLHTHRHQARAGCHRGQISKAPDPRKAILHACVRRRLPAKAIDAFNASTAANRQAKILGTLRNLPEQTEPDTRLDTSKPFTCPSNSVNATTSSSSTCSTAASFVTLI